MPETPSTPSEREQRLERVLADYLHAVEAGQQPEREEWLRRHPDLESELRSFFRNRDEVERLAGPIKEQNAPLPETIGPDGQVVEGVGAMVRYFGDYELREEIARGGMGVVYKARQVSLNRVVALKMILAGQLASESDVRRFRAEAEAAAHLDHPNILPIYEVGEHHGQHYFSMKLVPGGSLAARMAELRKDPRAAVTLLVQVARAVHFAHQRGVLHRDLKPGNVLLEESFGGELRGSPQASQPRDSPSGDSFTPFVTDFGLAKRVEGNSGLTAPGAIVGTPSYMPPEQARAEKGLTVAADVYALGAILYEVLTGRPPFQGASHVDTLLQVVEQEPEPPRRVNPAVARDLETVCLKCLAKEPAARYATAGDLADELERWLAGEPVSTRAPTRGERLAGWARRNPTQFALMVAMIIAAFTAALLPLQSPVIGGIELAVFMIAFFAFMMLQGHIETKGLEKRLRSERPGARPELAAAAPEPAPQTDAVPRGELVRALWRGARNGAFLGAGAATSLALLPWGASALIRWQGGSACLNLQLGAVVAVAAVPVVAGAVVAVLARALVRPFGRVAWGSAWAIAAIGVAAGTSVGPQHELLLTGLANWPLLLLVIAPAFAVASDLVSRGMVRERRRLAAAGQISPQMFRILDGRMPVSNFVVQGLPVVLLVGGVLAGNFLGAAVGQTIAPNSAAAGGDFGALVGRVSGALAGAVVAVGLLRLYRVEEAAPWPGQGDRPYPRALAALYLSATAVLAAVWFL